MAKVDIDLVKLILQRHEDDPKKVAAILEEIANETVAGEEETEPQPKKQFVVLARNEAALVVQILEDADPVMAVEKITKAMGDFNATPRGRRLPIKSIVEACEHVPAKLLKAHQVWVKTKEMVQIVALPTTK
jgi:hypothetical protein